MEDGYYYYRKLEEYRVYSMNILVGVAYKVLP